MNRFNRVRAWLFQPVDIAPLVYFRIIFAGIMLWEFWRFVENRWIPRYYIEPTYFFPYHGFEWIQPWAGDGMYLHFAVLALLGVLLLLGIAYRLSALLFFLGFTYVFLLDQTRYLNHFYLISLVSFLMIFLPLHRAFSVDALLRPGIRSQTVPNWTLWLLRFQLGIAYFYGGVAKLNADWLQGQPMGAWLLSSTDFPLIGHLFSEPWAGLAFSYGGLLLDLLIVPLLLWRRTRWLAVGIGTLFHLMNARLFIIGIFPWFMIGATLLFLEPYRFRAVVDWVHKRLPRRPQQPAPKKQPKTTPIYSAPPLRAQVIITGLLGIYAAWQVLLPLRHYLYPSYSSWSEEGQYFAWHMKLRDKEGDVFFYATDPVSGVTWSINPLDTLTQRQYSSMAGHPEMIHRFALHLAEEQRRAGHEQIQIRAWTPTSLNGRYDQLLIDPTIDLAAQPLDLFHNPWVLPLRVPLFVTNDMPRSALFARRGGSLIVVNMVGADFPLERLRLDDGEHTLAGDAWGLRVLPQSSCLMAHPASMATVPVYAACNEAGARLAVDEPVWNKDYTVYFDGEPLQTCGETCVVTVDLTPVETAAIPD